MKCDDFRPSSPGTLVRSESDSWAFLPNRLPPSFEKDDNLIARLASASLALGKLAGLGLTLPHPTFWSNH